MKHLALGILATVASKKPILEMKKLMLNYRLVLLLIVTILVACEATDLPKYEEMSEFELVMHNALLPENEQIVCQEKMSDWVGGSFRRIPRRCFTVAQLKQLQRDAEFASRGRNSASQPNPNAGTFGGGLMQ